MFAVIQVSAKDIYDSTGIYRTTQASRREFMSEKPELVISPFGEVSCDKEVEKLRDGYSTYFFDLAPFNREALCPEIYLIIGRRGSGKSSLVQYFTFQKSLPNARCVIINADDVYSDVFYEHSNKTDSTAEIAIPRIVRI